MSKRFIGLIFGGTLLSVFVYTGYLSSQYLIFPFKDTDVMHFSFLGLPLMVTYAFIAFLGVLNGFILKQIITGKYGQKSSTKWIYISVITGAVIGLSVNYANYYYVIKPNNLIECPLKVGYKKNLMRDYVTDLSLCEKF